MPFSVLRILSSSTQCAPYIPVFSLSSSIFLEASALSSPPTFTSSPALCAMAPTAQKGTSIDTSVWLCQYPTRSVARTVRSLLLRCVLLSGGPLFRILVDSVALLVLRGRCPALLVRLARGVLELLDLLRCGSLVERSRVNIDALLLRERLDEALCCSRARRDALAG